MGKMKTAAEVLNELAEGIRSCTLCPLHLYRKLAVPGEGPADAKIMLIGEAPGYHEDQQGRPFVGPAGRFLTELLARAGLRREDVFITNVVKCRPPNNRDPAPGEIRTCTSTWLEKQIEAINPQVIITLGRYSMALFLPNQSITKVHGQPHRVNGRVIVPMFHPAAALHQDRFREPLLKDFEKLPQILAGLQQPPTADTRPQQLSFF
jgi:DNA polymerase